MEELCATLFIIQNGFLALIGIIALYRYLWVKIAQSDSRPSAPEPRRVEQEESRELELEAELRSLREMAEMLALEQQRMRKEAALVDRAIESGNKAMESGDDGP